MRTFVWVSLAFTLFRQMFGAGRAFKLVREAMPGPRINLISLAAFVTIVNSGRYTSSELREWRLAVGGTALVLALALFEWAQRSIRGKFFS